MPPVDCGYPFFFFGTASSARTAGAAPTSAQWSTGYCSTAMPAVGRFSMKVIPGVVEAAHYLQQSSRVGLIDALVFLDTVRGHSRSLGEQPGSCDCPPGWTRHQQHIFN